MANKDIPSAEQAKIIRDFAREQQIEYYYEVGEAGIGRVLMPEQLLFPAYSFSLPVKTFHPGAEIGFSGSDGLRCGRGVFSAPAKGSEER